MPVNQLFIVAIAVLAFVAFGPIVIMFGMLVYYLWREIWWAASDALYRRRARREPQTRNNSTKDMPTTGGKGVRPQCPAKPYPPRPPSRVMLRDEPRGHQPSGPPVDWAKVTTPTSGTGARSPEPALIPLPDPCSDEQAQVIVDEWLRQQETAYSAALPRDEQKVYMLRALSDAAEVLPRERLLATMDVIEQRYGEKPWPGTERAT